MAEDTHEPRSILDEVARVYYSHDVRIIEAPSVYGGQVFRYKWWRTSAGKSGVARVWVNGGFEEFMRLLNRWSANAQGWSYEFCSETD